MTTLFGVFFFFRQWNEFYCAGIHAMKDFFSRFSLRNTFGRGGEDAAVRFLRRIGYRILARNVVNPNGRRLGEIDIVAEDGECIVFVEVKARISEKVPIRLSIGREKLHRLAKIGEWYMKHAGLMERRFRFDMVGIIAPEGEKSEITHIRDIFL